MKVLVIDIGGTHIKVASSDHLVPTKIVSGPTMTAKQMVADVLEATKGWEYEAVSIGYPGPVAHDRPLVEPHNLGPGWVGFPYQSALPKPIRFINDAAMQALGGYTGGKMLFLGIGTGLGSALIVDNVVVPLELAHLPYRKGKTYEQMIGLVGLKRQGKRLWRAAVLDVVARFRAAFVCDYVVLGGGNAKLMKKLPEGVLLGANSNAIAGGIALWHQPNTAVPQPAPLEAAAKTTELSLAETKRPDKKDKAKSGKKGSKSDSKKKADGKSDKKAKGKRKLVGRKG